jgi:hypothetical protein
VISLQPFRFAKENVNYTYHQKLIENRDGIWKTPETKKFAEIFWEAFLIF